MVSSDWNECLAPCGPFDFITFAFPQLEPALTDIFRRYTGNRLSLGQAALRIRDLLPSPITPRQMDAYLDEAFTTYPGVSDLIQWCADNRILFMINTTGMIGYFQRLFARRLLPPVPALSAHPQIRFQSSSSDPGHIFELYETTDKARNSAQLARCLEIPPEKIILMGDSGGDGPHFLWGSEVGAFLIGSMTKASLDSYCREHDIAIDLRFGPDYSAVEMRPQDGRAVDFMQLAAVIEKIAAGQRPPAPGAAAR